MFVIVFRMWINSLSIEGVYVNNLYEDLRDGIVLLKVMEKVEPNSVDWSQTELNPNNKFKKLNNSNYAVTVGKELGFTLVGISGSDILDANKKYILAFVWQIMKK